MLWLLFFLGQTPTSVEIDLKAACKPLVEIAQQGKESAVAIERNACVAQKTIIEGNHKDEIERLNRTHAETISGFETRLKTQATADTAAISQCFLTGVRTFKKEYKGQNQSGAVRVFVKEQTVCAARGFLNFEIHTLGNSNPFTLKSLQLRDQQNNTITTLFWNSTAPEPIWGATKQAFIAGFTLVNAAFPLRLELLGSAETITVDGISLPEAP